MELQHDLLVAYVYKIGDALAAQDKLDEAFKAYLDGLAIARRLAAADPTNTEWQVDLSASYDRIGDMLLQQKKLDDALKVYRDSLAIRERLATADPGSTRQQRALVVSYNKVGDVMAKQGKVDEALQAYRQGFAIMQHLAASGPGNTEWQRDLSVSYERIGDAMADQNKLEDALQAYRECLAIRQRLAAAGPSNMQWQSEVQLSIDRIGGMAYHFIVARNFVRALESADQAVSLAPEKIWIYSNRAHALMFLDRTDEARTVYLKYRSVKNVRGDRSWDIMILEGFAELRKVGLVHPLMDEIEKTFTAGG